MFRLNRLTNKLIPCVTPRLMSTKAVEEGSNKLSQFSLYQKGLLATLPLGTGISIYEIWNEFEPRPRDYDTCAGKILTYAGRTIVPVSIGILGGFIYPISGPLYFMWKYEKTTETNLCRDKGPRYDPVNDTYRK